jgi:hypothetical protein
MTLSITTLSMTTFSRKSLLVTLSIIDNQQNRHSVLDHCMECDYAEHHFIQCHVSFIVILSVIMLSVVMQSVEVPGGEESLGRYRTG